MGYTYTKRVCIVYLKFKLTGHPAFLFVKSDNSMDYFFNDGLFCMF